MYHAASKDIKSALHFKTVVEGTRYMVCCNTGGMLCVCVCVCVCVVIKEREEKEGGDLMRLI